MFNHSIMRKYIFLYLNDAYINHKSTELDLNLLTVSLPTALAVLLLL